MTNNNLIPQNINQFTNNMIEDFLYSVDKEVYQPFFNLSTKINPKTKTIAKIIVSNNCKLNCKFCSYKKDNSINRFILSENQLKKLYNKTIALGINEIIIESGAMDNNYYKNFLNLYHKIITKLPIKIYLDIGSQTLIDSPNILNVNNNFFIDYSPSDTEHQLMINSFAEQNKISNIINLYKNHFYANLIVDLPGQDFNDLVKDIIILKNSKIKGVKVSPFVPYINTPFSMLSVACSLTTFKVISLLRLIKPKWDIFIDNTINNLEYNNPMTEALKLGGNKKITPIN